MSDNITVPVYLEDENGVNIVDHEGNEIIVGFINVVDPIDGDDWDEILSNLDVAEVRKGFRLAKNIRGNLLRFEITEGEPGDFCVTYNMNQFGGRFRTLDVAVGSVNGTYARRGGWVVGSIIPRPEN